MSQFWEGVATGIATSGIVAGIVYWFQKRDSDRSVATLSTQIGETTAVASKALSTTLAIQQATTEIHKAVEAVQLAAAQQPNMENLRPEHLLAVDDFLQHPELSSLGLLHANLVGGEAIYAGILRDVEVSVSGNSELPLRPVPVNSVPDRIRNWLTSLDQLSGLSSAMRQTQIEKIVGVYVELMRIHPFFDGNGLLGRALIASLCRRLCGRSCLVPRNDPDFLSAVRLALTGDALSLTAYLERRIEA